MRAARARFSISPTTTAGGLAGLAPLVAGGTVTHGGQTHPADGNAGLVVTGRDPARSLGRDGIQVRLLSFAEGRARPGYMVGGVQADRDNAGTGLTGALDGCAGQERRAAGAERRGQAARAGVGDELEDVGPLERVPTGQDEQRPAEAADLVDQGEAFRRRQLVRVAQRHGLGAAVATGEIARPGDFPDDDERRLLEVPGRRMVGSPRCGLGHGRRDCIHRLTSTTLPTGFAKRRKSAHPHHEHRARHGRTSIAG
jgi:hypothetical protein